MIDLLWVIQIIATIWLLGYLRARDERRVFRAAMRDRGAAVLAPDLADRGRRRVRSAGLPPRGLGPRLDAHRAVPAPVILVGTGEREAWVNLDLVAAFEDVDRRRPDWFRALCRVGNQPTIDDARAEALRPLGPVLVPDADVVPVVRERERRDAVAAVDPTPDAQAAAVDVEPCPRDRREQRQVR